MAEILGAVASGATLAVLFKSCIEAFDLIQTSRHQENDLRKLRLRLNIEKCRLYIWGELMGLVDDPESNLKRSVCFPDVVQDILQTLLELFHDSGKIEKKYGCKQAESDYVEDTKQASPMRNLAASFSNFSVRSPQHPPQPPRTVRNFVWVIYDRKKFGIMVAETKDLIDSLQDITSPSIPLTRQKGRMKRKILNVSDAETLSLIAEVCTEDHPDVAEIASTKADTASDPSSHRAQMVTWLEEVDEGAWVKEEEKTLLDLEDMTVTELKLKIMEMLHQRKERRPCPVVLDGPLPPSTLFESLDETNNLPNDRVGQADYGVSCFDFGSQLGPSMSLAPTSNFHVRSNSITQQLKPVAGSFHSPSPSSYMTSIGSSTPASSFCDHADVAEVQSGGIHGSRDSSSACATGPLSARKVKMTGSPDMDQRYRARNFSDRRSSLSGSYTSRMGSRNPDKPYACAVEGCGKRYPTLVYLRRHRKKHTREELILT